jgi:cobalt-zinc-cadmium resistance protein CzcA
MDDHVFESARRMMSSATFGQIIILIVYLPIMALVGIEGKMFRPMAQVVAFAILGAGILSLTYVPMASALFLSRNTEHKRTFSDRLMGWFQMAFDPAIGWVLKHKLIVSAFSVAIFIFSLFVFSRLGGEFIPQLEEGDLASSVITLQGGSLTNTVETVIKANKILLDNFPEIKHTVCKIGAGEIPTDPTPMETGDYVITMKDKSEWTSAGTREELVEKMQEKLVTLAGVKFEFQQPIQMRFNELMTGSKQDIAVKIFGDDLAILAEKAADVERIIRQVEGVEDINVEKVTGLAQVQVDFNRDRLAQYGLSVDEVNRLLRAAFAGSQAGVVYDEEKRFGLVVRLDKDYRQNLDDVKNLTVALPNGSQLPFDQVADISIKSGPAQVSREDTKRRITVGFNVRNRDTQGAIREVTAKIDQGVKLPTGYYISYGGQFKNLEAAKNRLAIAVPVALLLIFVLLYFAFHSVSQTLIIFTAVPMSAIGGIFALWLRDMNFSISAGVGFIALFGVAVLNGIVLIAEFNRLEKEGMTDIKQRILKGLHTRLRPVIMTAAVASLGFLPMALSTSAGAEVQKPLATVVIGGLISATLLTLLVLPVFYLIFSSGFFRKFFTGTTAKTLTGILLLLILPPVIQSASAQPQKKVTLRDAIQTALDSNLSIRSAEYGAAVHKALKGASWDIPKTVIEGQYGQINSFQNDNSFAVSQAFSFPTVYVNQNKLSKANMKSSGLQLQGARLEVAIQVKQAYWQLAYLCSRRSLLVYQDSLYSGFSRAAGLRARAGETNRLEMITARTQSLEIKNQLQQALADVGILTRKLQTLMNSGVAVIPSDTAIRRIDFIALNDSLALSLNPSLGQVRQQVEVARLERRLEASRMMPDLSVGYFSQTMLGTQEINGNARTFDKGYRFSGVQAGIAIPVWAGPAVSKTKAAKIQEQASQASADYFTGSMKSNYRSLLDEYAKYAASIEYYEQQAVPEADLIIEQAARSYKAGALDYLEYIITMNKALEVKQNYLDALNSCNQTVINIDYITGKIF